MEKGHPVLEQSKRELTLEEAKSNFRAAMMEMDPVQMIRRKPLHVLGAAAFAGLMMGFAGKKSFSCFLPGGKDDLGDDQETDLDPSQKR